MTKERLLILDGNSLLHRAFYALPDLTNTEGVHTNAVFGFTTMLLKMKEELKPDYIVSAFDKKSPTFRHEQYKDYKAGRKKMPDELRGQFPIVKELLSLMSIDIFEIDGFEADDLIGTLAFFAEEKGIEVYIVTGDKDALQLASDNIKVVINKKGMTEKEIYDRDRMIEEKGVTPLQFIDVKGLMGDKSDNIPGVPGIGEKTAYKLIQEFGSVENVLNNIDKIKGNKIKENLMNYSEQAIFSKKLATIMTNVPIEINLDSIKSKENYDTEGLRELFRKLEFNSLLDKIPEGSLKKDRKKAEIKFNYIDNIQSLKDVFKEIDDEIYVLFNIENENSFSDRKLNKIYLNINENNYLLDVDKIMREDENLAIEALKGMFESNEIKKIGFDFKNAYSVLKKMGVSLMGVAFDVKIAAYLLDSSKGEYNLKDLEENYLKEAIYEEDYDFKMIYETYLLKKIYDIFNKKIKEENMEDLLYKVEQPLIEVLSSMELEGFKIDQNTLFQIGDKFRIEIDKLKGEIYQLSGEEFNINSPKQLGKILFEKLDLPVIKKTKTGYSTNAEVLEELSDKHPIIEKITYYRQLTKLYSTYIEGLKAVIDEDGKIHSSFNQTVTTTGRLSSTEPNLQNIPIKYEMGREIRKAFIPNNSESIILSADYSQIELRVLAHMAADENMISAFKHHIDIHTKTASEVFKVKIEDVTSFMRSSAKAVNFGIVYGIGDFSLAKDLKISRKEAKSYIDRYFERYPKVKAYLDELIIKARENMYVTTLLNRKRFIKEIGASNKIVRALGERLAMNAPIQGSAADIIKIAMVSVFNKLKENKLKSTLILQVHDELILNVYKDEIEKVKEIVKNEMEQVLELNVPLEVDISIGETWYNAK